MPPGIRLEARRRGWGPPEGTTRRGAISGVAPAARVREGLRPGESTQVRIRNPRRCGFAIHAGAGSQSTQVWIRNPRRCGFAIHAGVDSQSTQVRVRNPRRCGFAIHAGVESPHGHRPRRPGQTDSTPAWWVTPPRRGIPPAPSNLGAAESRLCPTNDVSPFSCTPPTSPTGSAAPVLLLGGTIRQVNTRPAGPRLLVVKVQVEKQG